MQSAQFSVKQKMSGKYENIVHFLILVVSYFPPPLDCGIQCLGPKGTTFTICAYFSVILVKPCSAMMGYFSGYKCQLLSSFRLIVLILLYGLLEVTLNLMN